MTWNFYRKLGSLRTFKSPPQQQKSPTDLAEYRTTLAVHRTLMGADRSLMADMGLRTSCCLMEILR